LDGGHGLVVGEDGEPTGRLGRGGGLRGGGSPPPAGGLEAEAGSAGWVGARRGGGHALRTSSD